MTLQPGTMLGPYEVLAQIGAGGMGEVYKGRDTRLDRLVAIKILPSHLADLPELRERFEREAHALANLKHANICVLYDIGRQELAAEEAEEAKEVSPSRDREGAVVRGGDQRPAGLPRWEPTQGRLTIHYLVMEYLEGETLSERLKKGPLPVEQVLQYAAEISAALDQAHRDGFTHRDIKPGNIMLVPQSGPGPKTGSKVLDFGLAKLKQEVVKATLPASEMPTVQGGLTQHGTLLGTLQYMSPEQIEGKVNEIDGRTDVFAFGAVVYEMGTGKKAFPGETQASIIAKVLEVDPPPMSSLQPPGRMVPPALDRVVKRCLAKNREDRWQTMRDLSHELTWIKEASAQGLLSQTAGGQAGTQGLSGAEGPAPPKLRERLAWGAAAAILVAFLGILGVLVFRNNSIPATAPSIRFSVPEPENAAFAGFGTTSSPVPAVSPDGLRLAFLATGDGGGAQTIWIRSFDSLTARMLPGTDGGFIPFWSADSRYVGFIAGGKLKKIDISGGPPLVLTDAPSANLTGGGTWNRDGVIVFSRSGGLFQVSAAGGEPTPITKVDESRGEAAHVMPRFLPDGRHFLYLVRSGKPEITGIYLASLDSAESVRLLSTDVKAEYSLGHLLFWRAGALLAQPFDATRLELTGDPFPVAEQVGANPGFGWAAYSASDSGTLVFGPGNSETTQLQWFDRGGRPLGPVGPPGPNYDPELSPDGRRVMVERAADLWLLDTVRSVATRFTFDPAFDANANWSPDGSRILFRSNLKGAMDLYLKPSSGVQGEEVLFQSSADKYPRDWSSDGQFILYGDSSGKGGMDLWVLPLAGDPSAGSGQGRKPFPLLQTDFWEDHAQISPDGRWFAYISNESGRYETYIQSFPKPGGKWQVSTGGGIAPRWRGDSRELYYIAPDQKLMAVAIRGDATLEVGQPTVLFQTRIFESGGFVETDKQQYDVTPDGQRFLINTPVEGATSPPLTVVLNWLKAVTSDK
jgi:serine/threonine protein kinase/Tol biopolymer transport system component